MTNVETRTGELFGSLWHRLSDAQYQESVDLFRRRFEANGFDLAWFRGKRCLDAGTGSGRYAVAMAIAGGDVVGCDVSTSGLATARARAQGVPNLSFVEGSVLDLPFPDAAFDFVCCAGVLHHTPSIAGGLDQITRVLKPGGKMFLLLYGAGGLRWKLVRALRPLAAELGQDVLHDAITAAGLPDNNRKHWMDDLFVPILDQVAWIDLEPMLATRGYSPVERWMQGRFDHESSIASQIEDMDKARRIFACIKHPLGRIGERIGAAFCDEAATAGEDIVIGEGNHRVMAQKRM